jgi:hypothetical protein
VFGKDLFFVHSGNFSFIEPHHVWRDQPATPPMLSPGIRVASKHELIDRIHQYFEEINAAPVVFRWKYKMDESIIV